MKTSTLSTIMKRAWAIKKENKLNIFSICLKMAWAEAKKESFIQSFTKSIQELASELTVSEWIGGNNHRLYVNYNRKMKGYLIVKNNIVVDYENNASPEMMNLLKSYVGQKIA